PAGKLAGVALPNGVVTSYGYDAADRITSVMHRQGPGGPVVAGASYLLDAAGNRLRETYHDGSFTAYGYDSAYRLTNEHYKSATTEERRTYSYSPGGDRLRETVPGSIAWDRSWLENFNRDQLGADYDISGGEWALTGDTDKQLERITSNPETQSGPVMVTNNAQSFSGPVQVFAKLIPLDGTAEKPLTSAVVFGWTDAGASYWLAGARTWTAIPQGGTEQQLHAKYFIAQFADGQLDVKVEASEPEILPVGVTSVEVKLQSIPGILTLLRRYNGGDWDERVNAPSPWTVASPMPASRAGVYSDRDAPEAASGKFDDLKVEWTSGQVTEEAADYVYNAMHELQSVTGLNKNATYTYDLDGNRLTEEKGGVRRRFGYTFENRLKNVWQGPDGSEVLIRAYEFQGDSWMRRSATEDGVTQHFLYDGDNLLAEFDSGGTLAAHHATNGIDRTLWTVRGTALQTPLSGADDVLAVADVAGSVTARYRYRAFGERVNLTGGDPARQDPSFQGRTLDGGLGIYDYRNRSFDPATGRFLQRDPVLGGDPLYNPYCFPGNNPSGLDPMGLGEGHHYFPKAIWEPIKDLSQQAKDVFKKAITGPLDQRFAAHRGYSGAHRVYSSAVETLWNEWKQGKDLAKLTAKEADEFVKAIRTSRKPAIKTFLKAVHRAAGGAPGGSGAAAAAGAAARGGILGKAVRGVGSVGAAVGGWLLFEIIFAEPAYAAEPPPADPDDIVEVHIVRYTPADSRPQSEERRLGLMSKQKLWSLEEQMGKAARERAVAREARTEQEPHRYFLRFYEATPEGVLDYLAGIDVGPETLPDPNAAFLAPPVSAQPQPGATTQPGDPPKEQPATPQPSAPSSAPDSPLPKPSVPETSTPDREPPHLPRPETSR
ncbi:MAG: hypothetical protein JW741_17235, partial [Sedimentisphaerales bacterium]|nr:hypothetical protein [Sedimentisphaerales bacterium]